MKLFRRANSRPLVRNTNIVVVCRNTVRIFILFCFRSYVCWLPARFVSCIDFDQYNFQWLLIYIGILDLESLDWHAHKHSMYLVDPFLQNPVVIMHLEVYILLYWLALTSLLVLTLELPVRLFTVLEIRSCWSTCGLNTSVLFFPHLLFITIYWRLYSSIYDVQFPNVILALWLSVMKLKGR